MFRETYQKGFLTIFQSNCSNPLLNWKSDVKNGYIKRLTDSDDKLIVMEIMGSNVITTYITTPINPKMSLGIKLPFLILLIKNMRKFFSFEVTVLDDKYLYRRFRLSNYQSKTRCTIFCTCMPLGLSPNWNQIQFNLADFTKRAYGTNYLETVRVQINANCRIRRIYFTDRLYTNDEIPNDYKLKPSKIKSKIVEKNKYKLYNMKIPEQRPPTPEKYVSEKSFNNSKNMEEEKVHISYNVKRSVEQHHQTPEKNYSKNISVFINSSTEEKQNIKAPEKREIIERKTVFPTSKFLNNFSKTKIVKFPLTNPNLY